MTGVLHKLVSGVRVVRLRGVSYLIEVMTDVLWPKLCTAVFNLFSPSRLIKLSQFVILSLAFVWSGYLWKSGSFTMAIVVLLCGCVWVSLTLFHRWITTSRYLQQARSFHMPDTNAFTQWMSWPVDSSVRVRVDAHVKAHTGLQEIVLGTLDNDGRVFGTFGPLPGLVSVDEQHFTKRYQNPLEIVLRDGLVLVKKRFDSKASFAREWVACVLLHGKANIPAIYHADESNWILYKNLVQGKTLRDILVERGASIRTDQTDTDEELHHLTGEQRLNAILSRGRQHLKSLPESFLPALEAQLNAIHREGITGVSLTFGNVMMDSREEPCFIDCGKALLHASMTSPLFLWHRDQDRKKFNQIYGDVLMTEASARTRVGARE